MTTLTTAISFSRQNDAGSRVSTNNLMVSRKSRTRSRARLRTLKAVKMLLQKLVSNKNTMISTRDAVLYSVSIIEKT